MFGTLKNMFGGGNDGTEVLGAPIAGEAVSVKEVSDPTFSEEIIGKGMAIKPSSGKVVAPADGTVGMVFETKHAVSITTQKGAELIIHIGLDTVNLKGEHFTAHVKAGDTVKAGDLLVEFDMEKIIAAGYDVISPMIVCNSDDYKTIEPLVGKQVKELDEVLRLEK